MGERTGRIRVARGEKIGHDVRHPKDKLLGLLKTYPLRKPTLHGKLGGLSI